MPDNVGRIRFQRAFGLMIIFLAAFVLQCVALFVMPEPGGPFGLSTMVNAHAKPPFAYRVLMPLSVMGLEVILKPVANKVDAIWDGDWTQEGNITNNRAKSLLKEHIGAKNAEDARHIVMWSVASVACFAIFGGFMWRFFVLRGIGESASWALSVGLMLLVVPILLRPPLQMYDPMTLAFGAALAYFGLRKAWIPFLLALALAGLAKEALLVLAILPIIEGWQTRSWRRIIATVVVVAGSYWISRQLGGGGSSVFQMTWQQNLELLQGKNLGSFLMSVVALLPVIAIVATAWKAIAPENRRILIVTAAAMLPPLLIFGRLVEARIFYDILPLALMLAAPCSWLVGFEMPE